MLDKIVKFFRDLLYLSYQDARGFFNLLAICFLVLTVYFGIRLYLDKEIKPDAADVIRLDSLSRIMDSAIVSSKQPVLFVFDPNTLSSDSLELLGFPKKLAERLINFRAKGAVFREKSDLKKVYGFPEDLYASISTYIDLPDSLTKGEVSKKSELIDINKVDEKSLASAAGIAIGIAQRILKYRFALGGYVTESQLSEVYGISASDTENVQKAVFVMPGFVPKKLKVNQADENVLKSHPYISDQAAADIVRFREINGKIGSAEVLSGFKSITSDNFEKLILYIDFDY